MTVLDLMKTVPSGISNWSAKFRKWIRTEVSQSKGKKFVLTMFNQGTLAFILRTEESWLRRFLRAGRLSEKEVMVAFEEMELRLKNKSPALQTWKGTFVEVLFVMTRKYRALEVSATDASLTSLIEEMVKGDGSFFRAGQKLVDRNDTSKLVGEALSHEQLPWLAGKESEALIQIEKIKKAQSKFESVRDSAVGNAAQRTTDLGLATSIVENRIRELVKLIDPQSIEVALDMAIGGELFVDRAVILTLKSGERLLLVSTEFKNYFLRGAKKQQAKRNPRLFEASPNTSITYNTEVRSADGKLIGFNSQKVTAKDFMLNAATESNDRLLVNLAKYLQNNLGANSVPDVQFDSVPITLATKEVRSALGIDEKAYIDSTKKSKYDPQVNTKEEPQVNTNVIQVQWVLDMGVEPLLARIFAAFKG